jgi:S1-C subfamily serine protease
MNNLFRSHFASAVLGGLIVGGGLLALGVTGRQTTQTIVGGTPVAITDANPSFGLSLHDIYRRYAPGVVFIRARLVAPVHSPFTVSHQQASSTSTGSGFLVDRRGDILTDYHVVAGAERAGGVTVDFEGGVSRAANVVGVDRPADLAILKVDVHGLTNLRPLPLGDSTTVRVGDPTLAIGNPFGVDRTLTSGIVAALQHEIPSSDGLTVDNVIQTNQPLDPGGAGGPLFDATGRVIGVNSQLASTAQNGTGVSFATPVDTALPMLARVRRDSSLRVAYIGLSGVSARGAHPALSVTSAVPGGPAAAGGLRHGDSIEKLDGSSISSMGQFQSLLSVRNPGQTVSLAVRRGGRVRTLKVLLGSQLAPQPGR